MSLFSLLCESPLKAAFTAPASVLELVLLRRRATSYDCWYLVCLFAVVIRSTLAPFDCTARSGVRTMDADPSVECDVPGGAHSRMWRVAVRVRDTHTHTHGAVGFFSLVLVCLLLLVSAALFFPVPVSSVSLSLLTSGPLWLLASHRR